MSVLTEPAVVDAEVVSSRTQGAYRVLTFEAPTIAPFNPGQFVTIAPGHGLHLLRRPFSIYRVDGAQVSVAFDAIGFGTQWLAHRAPGDRLSVVGPLGHGFETQDDPGQVLVVGGGYGTAALVSLACRVSAAGGTVHAVVGARTAARLFTDDALTGACATTTIVTDDGTAGTEGIVTDPMPASIERHAITTIYACGPNRMLEAVGRAAERAGVPAQLAVEEFMACGIGVCWTCVIPVRVDGVVKHLRSCTEGPVFDGAAIAWT